MRNALLIFIKNPALGKVKTRLAKSIGDLNALKVYQHLLDHTMEITYELDADKFLYYDEFIPTKDIWPASAYQKELQKGEHLGEKMNTAFTQVFDEGFKKVLMIMPDCPKMSDSLIDRAFKLLDSNDFVVGPTNDGGFYLLGMNKYNPDFFAETTYETATSLEHALKTINATGKKHFLMPELIDVDMEEDLGALKKMLKLEELPEKLAE
ncbi:MAG: TIGR04282 family arsenosugar biosynthesis glycosyltransferase [Bacteroidetes bacterium]|nr:TIGR04282 family arsenosugar biosynthesis glycosyltransferase [Bacteroidota bacterium]